MNSQLDNSRYTRQILSNSTRRDVLWNVSQPGDPYDIKKSMIAKLPGDKKVPMGQHLQLVCLLQAAEIERLCQFLDQYKLKFREIQRNNLDRHSYEVQIKELTEKVNGEQSLKIQYSKLRDFSKKLQIENQQLQRGNRSNSQLQEGYKLNYQRTLERIEALMKQNTELRQQNEEYRFQIQSFAARQQALQRAKNRQIEDLKLNFTQYSRESYQSAISSYRLQSEAEVKRLQYQLKRIKQMSDAKNAQISDLQQRLRNATTQIKQLSQRYNSRYQLQGQIREYENKFVIFGTQIQRLNIALRDCTNKFQDSDRKRKQLQNKLYQTESSINQYESIIRQKDSQIYKLTDQLRRFDSDSQKIGQIQQLVSQYESQLTKQVRELQLTNSKLKYELDNSKRLREQIQRLTFENSRYKLLEKENAGLKESSIQLSNLKRRLAELENKIMLLAQENQRLQFVSKSKEAEIQKYRNLALENQTLKSKISQTEYTITSKYQYEVSRIKSEYEQKLDYLSKSQGSQIQSRIQNYEGELQRLKNTLRTTNEQRQNQRSRIYELQASVSRSELENTTKLKNYELALNNLKRENQDLYNKLKIASDAQRKVFESQSRLSQYDRQLDRISNNLKQRQQQVLALKGKLRQSELALQRYEFDLGKSKSGYEQTMSSLKLQNEALNKRLSELVSESNKKLMEASQEIERLGNAIRAKNEEKIQLQSRLKQALQQLQYSRQGLQKLTSENDELKKRIFQSEAKINSFLNDSNSNIRALSQQNEQLRRQIKQTKNQINLWQFQINKKTTIYQQNNQTLIRQNQDLKHKITDYQTRLTLFSQQIQRLGFQLKNKTDQYNAKKIQCEKLVQSIKQYQIQVNNHLQGQVKKKFLENQQRIKELFNENQDLRKKLGESTQRFNIELEKANLSIRQLAQENDALKQQLRKFSEEKIRLQTTIKQISNENEGLKKQFKQYQIQINQNYQGQIQRQNRLYQQNITRINQQNEQLRRKLQELGGQFSRKTTQNDNKYITMTQQYEKLRGNATALVQQNADLKKKLQAYEVSIKNYETEVNRRFASYQQNANISNKQNQELRRRLQDLGDLNRKIIQYENRIALLGQELERLNGLLTKASQENEALRRQLNEKSQQSSNYELQFSRKVTTYESNIGFLQKENEDLKRRNIEYQQRLRTTISELDNANNNLQKHQSAIRQYQGELLKSRSTSDQRINNLQASNEQLKKKLLQYGDVNRKTLQMENRLALLSQQLQRLTNNLRSKHEENVKLQGQLRSQANEVEIWRKKCNDLQLNFNNTYENEIKRRYATYEQTISELNRRNTETQVKLNSSVQEIQRLSNILRLKADESSQQAANLRSLKNQNDELNRRIKDSQNNFSQNAQALKRENDDLRRKIQQYQTFLAQIKLENERRSIQTESRFKSLSQQNDRITSILKTRTQELELTRKQFKQYEFSVNQKMEGQVKTQLIQLDSAVSSLKKENQELRRRLQQAGDLSRTIAEYQNKIMLLSQEIQRLNTIITSKGEQNIRLTKQADELRRKLTQFSQINRKIPQYEQKMGLLLQQNEKMQVALRNKTDELGALDMKYRQSVQEIDNLRKKVTTVQNTWVSKFDMEVNKRTSNYQQNLNALNKERDDLLRRKGDYEAKIALLSQQLQRIGGQLKIKSEESLRLQAEIENMRKMANQKIQSSQSELTILQTNYNTVTKQYQTAKRHLEEYELSIRKLYTEFERLQGIINELKKQNQSLHSMNHNLSSQIQRLTNENKDLQVQVEQVRLRLSDESALQKRINQHLALMVVLFAEIETLRSRVKDKEKQVAEVRRSSLAPNIL